MRKIWPTANTTIKRSSDEAPVSVEQFISLETKVEEQNDAIESLERDLSSYKTSQKNKTTTNEVDTKTLTSESITSDSADIDDLTVQTITGDNIEVNNSHIVAKRNVVVLGQNTVVKDVSAEDVVAETITTDRLTANEIDAPTIHVDSVHANEYTADKFSVTDIDIEHADIAEESVVESEIEHASIDDATIKFSAVEELEAEDAEIDTAEIDYLDNSIATHSKYQLIEQEEAYIILPKFTNGTYVLEAKAPGDIRMFSIEVDNSEENVRFKWSMNKKPFLLDADIVREEPFEFLQLHIQTFGLKTYLYYKSDSTDNTEPPGIYSSKQYSSNIRKHFEFSQMSGSILPNSIFAGQFHAEELLIDDTVFDVATIESKIRLTQEKDALGHTVIRTEGNAGDYITNVEDENGFIYPTWQGRSTEVDSTDDRLITSKAVAEYDGTDYAGTKDAVEEVHNYPITNLGDNTTVHGSLTVQEDFSSPSISDIEVEDDEGEKSQVLSLNNPIRTSDELPFAVQNNLTDGKLVVYSEEDDALASTDDAALDTLDVRSLQVAENAVIGGDLIVKGKTITTEEETVSTSSDMLVLRQNNDAPLTSGETSGILINKYNGTDNLALVVDNTGTLRVGDTSGTTHTYVVIYYKEGKWYTDEELEQEVTPSGELTAWASKEVSSEYTKYTNATFTAFRYTDLSPVLGRDEISNMTNKGLLIWNNTTWEANTLSIPATNGCSLKYNTTTSTYYWEKSPGVYVFATRDDYDEVEDDIPVGSMIIIEDEYDYTISEDA